MTEQDFRAKCRRVDMDIMSILQYWLDEQTADVWSLTSNEFQRLQKQRKNVIDFVDFIHNATITLKTGIN